MRTHTYEVIAGPHRLTVTLDVPPVLYKPQRAEMRRVLVARLEKEQARRNIQQPWTNPWTSRLYSVGDTPDPIFGQVGEIKVAR